MKRIYYLLIATVISVFSLSCERDDICAETTATTPRLRIEFYDTANTADLKSVSRISVYGEGLFTDLPIIKNDSTLLFDENSTEVALPLKIDTEATINTTRFILEKETNLRLDDDATTTSNTDVIEITYVPEFVYVSRACGYKSIYKALQVTIIDDGDLWLSYSSFPNTSESTITVENENETHVQLFH